MKMSLRWRLPRLLIALALAAVPLTALSVALDAGVPRTLFTGTAIVNGGDTIKPNGYASCVFEWGITQGTMTMEVQHQRNGSTKWTTVTGCQSSADGFKCSVTTPGGLYRGAATACNAPCTGTISFECWKYL